MTAKEFPEVLSRAVRILVRTGDESVAGMSQNKVQELIAQMWSEDNLNERIGCDLEDGKFATEEEWWGHRTVESFAEEVIDGFYANIQDGTFQ